jgi:hypothetical protein
LKRPKPAAAISAAQGEAPAIVIAGALCGLKNVCQISRRPADERVESFLTKHFCIERTPCYYWLLCLLKLIELKSLNQCLMRRAQPLLPTGMKALTISFDGETVRSTGKMEKHAGPLHIISAHVAELGITAAGQKAADKSNEIPAVRGLIRLLELEGCIAAADASD